MTMSVGRHRLAGLPMPQCSFVDEHVPGATVGASNGGVAPEGRVVDDLTGELLPVG